MAESNVMVFFSYEHVVPNVEGFREDVFSRPVNN
jgi:hypothetical protein